MRRSSHWFSGILMIFVVAIVVFLGIYFFVPEVSQKFFGVAFGEGQDVTEAIMDYIGTSLGDKEEIQEFFSSKEGKKLVDNIIALSKKGGDAVREAFENPQVKEFFNEASEYAEAGLGTVQDYLRDNFDRLEALL